MRYKKKPVIIEAIQWDGTLDGINYIQRNFNVRTVCCEILGGYLVKHWSIETLEGSYVVSPRDYIIKGVKGEFYPCKPDIFELTYEEVE